MKKSIHSTLIFRLSGEIFFGLSGGFIVGLEATIEQFVLRIILTKNGYSPWNYEHFLEHAVHHRFIQRTDGRYRFIHDLLREHFAQMTPQEQHLLDRNT